MSAEEMKPQRFETMEQFANLILWVETEKRIRDGSYELGNPYYLLGSEGQLCCGADGDPELPVDYQNPDATKATVRLMAIIAQCDSFAFVSEGWGSNRPDLAKKLQDGEQLEPEDMPKNDPNRIEVFTIVTGDRDGNRFSIHRIIRRDPKTGEFVAFDPHPEDLGGERGMVVTRWDLWKTIEEQEAEMERVPVAS